MNRLGIVPHELWARCWDFPKHSVSSSSHVLKSFTSQMFPVSSSVKYFIEFMPDINSNTTMIPALPQAALGGLLRGQELDQLSQFMQD